METTKEGRGREVRKVREVRRVVEDGRGVRVWVPLAADWARYGARPLTAVEVAAEKRLIERLRREGRKGA